MKTCKFQKMGVPYNLYMATTADELELPICVGTAREVAAYLGIPVDRVYYTAIRQKSGKVNGYKIFKIEGGMEDE